MNRAAFYAFQGENIEQESPVLDIGEGFECWDLRQLSFDDFILAIQAKIPPINEEFVKKRQYKCLEGEESDLFCINEADYKRASWGIYLPDASADPSFLINLYSPTFLYPIFCVGDSGVNRLYKRDHRYPREMLMGSKNLSALFKTSEFVDFFKMFSPVAEYGHWNLRTSESWSDEDWRLFTASLLYIDLQKYDNIKTAFQWQRESADMCTLLECLFTSDDGTTEIIYRLKKRIAVLLWHYFPAIEKDIGVLYKSRSEFVHGAFFKDMAKKMKGKDAGVLPVPDFELLYKQKEFVRGALIAYLHLHQEIKTRSENYGNPNNVKDLLESAIIDTKLRGIIEKEVIEVLRLLIKPQVREIIKKGRADVLEKRFK